jgi:hypothetical protein
MRGNKYVFCIMVLYFLNQKHRKSSKNLITDTSNEAWDLIDATIHEWHESAIAITSPDLAAAFNDETKKGKLS